MKNLLRKEFKLATFSITWFFLAFSLMTFLPGYPILMSGFFICFGVFQSVQLSRESEDITYSVLLPIRKKDVVTAKYISAVTVQMIGFTLCTVFTVLRVVLMSTAKAYVSNKLMPANLTYLAYLLIVFGLFNFYFLGGFFKTAYYYGKPFIFFAIASLLFIITAEILWHIPALSFLGSLSPNFKQVVLFICCVVIFVLLTYVSLIKSQKQFEKIDI